MAKTSKASLRGRPKGRSGQETLAAILLSARQCFAENGYGGTSFKDVSSALGISHAALYNYFPNKAELYFATLADAQQSLLPLCLEALNGETTIRGKLKAILQACADSYETQPHITGFLGSVLIDIQRHPELQPVIVQTNELMGLLVGVIEQARRDGELCFEQSPEEFFITFTGAAMGMGVFSFGIGNPSMRPTVDIFMAMLDGTLFREER